MDPKHFPRVDEHIVVPEITRDEVICGRKVVAVPVNAPHADTRVLLRFVIMPHVCNGYIASAHLLTRVSEESNFATDVCIRKEGIDPQTGARYLEELSFEIVNEQSLRDATDKARELTKRGVRRVFAIFLETKEVGEWSKNDNQFVLLPKDGALEDPLLIRPLAVEALLDRSRATTEVVRALDFQQHPEIVKIEQRSFQQGLDDPFAMCRDTLVRWAQSRFGELPSAILNRIYTADAQTLARLTDRMAQAAALSDVFEAEVAAG